MEIFYKEIIVIVAFIVAFAGIGVPIILESLRFHKSKKA